MLEGFRVVHQNGVDIRGKIIPDGAGDQVQVPVEQAGGLLFGCGAVQVFPLLQEKLEVLGQVLGLGLLPGGADDETHLRGQADFLGQLLEAQALIFLFDLAGNPQVGLFGQEHQVAPRHGYVSA